MPNPITYRAVIREPNKPLPKADKYGTLTLEAESVDLAQSPVPLRMWATDILKTRTPGAYCEIYRTEETLVERIYKEETK